ncbi:hypothetical protein Hrd1104_01500 [Halorhabdus sp. CBA1104]|nr:hypothetical protein Hrd1104_01500 [Halorhabdus sp. CBA1104]
MILYYWLMSPIVIVPVLDVALFEFTLEINVCKFFSIFVFVIHFYNPKLSSPDSMLSEIVTNIVRMFHILEIWVIYSTVIMDLHILLRMLC